MLKNADYKKFLRQNIFLKIVAIGDTKPNKGLTITSKLCNKILATVATNFRIGWTTFPVLGLGINRQLNGMNGKRPARADSR